MDGEYKPVASISSIEIRTLRNSYSREPPEQFFYPIVQIDDRKFKNHLLTPESYKGIKLLFPGDCAIHFFEDMLPDKIDIVKLPHHGSGKNTDKNFIRNTYVSYYLISTNGKHQEHPSPKIIANILTKAPGHPMIIKNYDIPILEGIGKLEKEKIWNCQEKCSR